jgi:hypothetical protein
VEESLNDLETITSAIINETIERIIQYVHNLVKNLHQKNETVSCNYFEMKKLK